MREEEEAAEQMASAAAKAAQPLEPLPEKVKTRAQELEEEMCAIQLAEDLVHACRTNHEHGVVLLLRRGVRINWQGRDGKNALMTAAGRGHLGIVKKLIEAGASLDLVDIQDASALVQAATYGRLKTCLTLVKAGANCALSDRNGNSVYSVSRADPARLADLTALLTTIDGHRRAAATKLQARYRSRLAVCLRRAMIAAIAKAEADLLKAAIDTQRWERGRRARILAHQLRLEEKKRQKARMYVTLLFQSMLRAKQARRFVQRRRIAYNEAALNIQRVQRGLVARVYYAQIHAAWVKRKDTARKKVGRLMCPIIRGFLGRRRVKREFGYVYVPEDDWA
jgi:hypothetical protein